MITFISFFLNILKSLKKSVAWKITSPPLPPSPPSGAPTVVLLSL